MQEFKRFADLRFSGSSDIPFINSTSLTFVSKLKDKYGELAPINHIQTILKDYLRSSRIYYSLKAKTIKSFKSMKRLLEISLNRYFRSVRSMSILNMRNVLASRRGEFSETEIRSLQKALSESNYDTFVRVYRRFLRRISGENNEVFYKQLVDDAKYNSFFFMKREIALIVVKYFCNYANYVFKASEELVYKHTDSYLNYLRNISLTVLGVAEEFTAKYELNGYHPMILSNDPVTHFIILSNDTSIPLAQIYSIWKQWMNIFYNPEEEPSIDRKLLGILELWYQALLDEDNMNADISQEMRNYQRDQQYIKDRRENLREWNNDLETFRDMYNDGTINISRMEKFLEDVLQEDFRRIELLKGERESEYQHKRRLLEDYFPQMKDAIEEMENLFGRIIG